MTPYPEIVETERNGTMSATEDERTIEYTWNVICRACGTGSSGAATSYENATAAMRMFTERTCQSAHFQQADDHA